MISVSLMSCARYPIIAELSEAELDIEEGFLDVGDIIMYVAAAAAEQYILSHLRSLQSQTDRSLK